VGAVIAFSEDLVELVCPTWESGEAGGLWQNAREPDNPRSAVAITATRHPFPDAHWDIQFFLACRLGGFPWVSGRFMGGPSQRSESPLFEESPSPGFACLIGKPPPGRVGPHLHPGASDTESRLGNALPGIGPKRKVGSPESTGGFFFFLDKAQVPD